MAFQAYFQRYRDFVFFSVPLCRQTHVVVDVIPGQPRRHLLQSGWSVFVSSKRLVAGDAFIFLRFVDS